MKVRILLCGCEGVQADAVASGLRGFEVVDAPGICRRPGELEAHRAGADNLVVAACRARVSLGEFQRAARRIGLDPLGLELVDPRGAGGDPARLAVILAAAVARASAFEGSRPEHAKPVLPDRVSRRSLLLLSLPEYRAAPAVDPERCAAETGCRVCVDACPRGALRRSDGRVVLDVAACETCGICVTGCPTGAMVNPAFTPAQVRDQVATLLDPGVGPPGPRAIVFTCRGATRVETDPGWYPVEVPCTGMVRAGWLLAPLAMGAGAVAVRRCSDSGCPLRHDDLVELQVDFAHTLLAEWGAGPERVAFEPGGPLPEPLVRLDLADPFGPLGGAEVLVSLARCLGVAETERVVHAASPTGIVEIDPGTCTGCAMCAERCPTGALTRQVGGDRVAITFDAARCTACELCLGGCPEIEAGTISLVRGVDLARLGSGRVQLFADEQVRCEVCGQAVAPAAMLARVRAMLGGDHAGTMDLVSRRCSECRGIFART